MSDSDDEFVFVENEKKDIDKFTIKYEAKGELDIYIMNRENGNGDGEDYVLIKKTPFAEPFWGVVVNRI